MERTFGACFASGTFVQLQLRGDFQAHFRDISQIQDKYIESVVM
jgi:hypothetical protein